MPPHLLPSLLLSILAVGYSPGPANIYALTCALTHGRKKSLKMWLGQLFGFSVMAIIASTSAHFVGMALGKYVFYVKYLGAAYLVYLAWKIYRSSISEGSDTSCTFLSGAIVQMTNAKMVIYELTIYSTFVLPYSDKLSDLYIAAAWLLIAGPLANLVWLLAGSFMKPLFENYHKTVNTIMAIVILMCAVAILLYKI